MKRSYSSIVSSISAIFLGVTGFSLLFAADNLMPMLVPGFPAAGQWVGQMQGAAWIGIAAQNWLNRSALIGGIYSRGITSANAVVYFTSAMVLINPLRRGEVPSAVWFIFIPIAVFAAIYVWLLFRGPFQRDLQQHAK